MSKLDILRKILGAVEESMPVSDERTNHKDNQVKSRPKKLTDNPEEEAIRALAQEFAKALNNRDYEHLDGRAEYHLYTMNHLIELVKNNDEQKTIKLFNENKIKSKFEDCEFISITFSTDPEQAVVVYNVRTCLDSAAEKFFNELNKNNKTNTIKSGTPFSTVYTLVVKKEKGAWKVNNFEATGNLKA
nr:hypothetical protein [Desulfosporosinus orientis]